ncbi:glyoxalase domain-containing protein 4 [Diaphorina citri]|uniref:Glyoxalase domain-containing protein 4 n=1 Tax=Diaphorina citri TaxID=121845 RepID=A0A1S4EAF3_DIACI|nr:glyoxalase domain-containing protein 4 [Diaphorina citri]
MFPSPYDNRWSKTMMGYGPEDSHFVIELTYNYNVHEYVLGNDFRGISVKNKKALDNAKAQGWPVEEVGQGRSVLTAPGGYKYFVHDEEPASGKDPVQGVTLASSDLKRSIQYWNELLGLKIFSQNDSSVTLGFAEDQAKLTLEKIDSPVDHATAYGRVAFSVPEAELSPIDVLIKEHNQTILTPLVTLPTPGKADVTVIILADPDGHEICFVGDEAFRQLSQVDPESDAMVDRYIQKDEERSKSS